jgi:hypothetical protein
MSVELQKISGFLLFLVMKYVSETAEDQHTSSQGTGENH